MPEPTRIAVVDDHPLFRQGVSFTLRSAPDLEVVAEGASGPDAIRTVAEHAPDIILLDVSMPGGGIEAAREIRRISPDTKIIMLTVSESENDVTAAMQAGANGYILKGSSGPDLLQIVRSVQNGEMYVTPTLAARLLVQMKQPAARRDQDIDALTYRENQILQLLARGLTNKEIAIGLKLTEKTVKHYMTDVMQKLKARNRVEAALIAKKQFNGAKPAINGHG
jgi:two-component system nitrate/nitrite response regulator NarL